MIKIYSKVEPEKLLHIVYTLEDFKPGREDIIEPDNFIQCSALQMELGKTFKPHKHIWGKNEEHRIAQESWIVIKGSVLCHFYDIDDKIISMVTLHPGDASFTLEGGHNYTVLEDGTIVYEYKTGPYKGQILDKTFI